MKTRAKTESRPHAPTARVQPNPPGIDYRKQPDLYKIARGEQGVLTVEPYKSEILPHWRFRWDYVPNYRQRSIVLLSEQAIDQIGLSARRVNVNELHHAI